MTNYEEYLEFNEIEDKQKQEELLPKIVIDYETTNKIKSISKKQNFLIFAEPYCPDSRILVALIERMRTLNPTNIDIEYLSRKDNFGKLNMLSMENKIPTVFLVDGIKMTRVMEEFPDKIKEILTDEVKADYREGKYNKEIIDCILERVKNE